MAIPSGSGTETLHSHLFENTNAAQTLILGVQHHVYTVLSVIMHANAIDNLVYLNLYGHDGHGGLSGRKIRLAQFAPQVGDTFVWGDKFSFNGYEPTGTNVFSAAEQIQIAAQSGGTAQYLQFEHGSGSDDIDITVTYIDQDWT